MIDVIDVIDLGPGCRVAVSYDCGGIYRAHGRGYCHNDDDAADNIAAAIARHYTRAGWSCACRKVYPGTPYDVYTEVVAVAPGYGTADSLARAMDQWRDGDAYCLELQALSDGEWYPLDHLCGVYGDQLDDVARDMARDVVGGRTMRRVARAVVALVQIAAIAAVAFTAMWAVWAAYKTALWLLLVAANALGTYECDPGPLIEAVTTFVPGPPAC